MRIISVIIIALLVVFAPAWLYLPAILFGIIFFDLFVEGIILAFFADLLYGKGFYHGFLFGFTFTILAIVCVCASVFAREKLRLNA